MTLHQDRKLLGFVDVDLGRRAVRVPVQAVDPLTERDIPQPLVSFECEGGVCEILVRGDASSAAVGQALPEVVAAAVRHLSAKLLN
jgi:hypothetical protein